MRQDGVTGKIGQQEWLKPAEEGLQNLIHKAFQIKGGRQAKNFLHGWTRWARGANTELQPMPR